MIYAEWPPRFMRCVHIRVERIQAVRPPLFAETDVLFAEWPLSFAFAKSYKVEKWPM